MNRAEYNANQCRIDHNITDLPLKLATTIDLAKSLNATVLSYNEAGDVIDNLHLYDTIKLHDAITVLSEDKSNTLILYNDELDSSQKTFALLHEIAHIYSSHLTNYPLGLSDTDDAQEAEANIFARCFIAPPYVLWRMKCTSPKQIQTKTLLDHDNAHITSDLIEGADRSSPTDQELRLWRMMSGKRRFVLPASVVGGVAALAITGVIIWAAVGHTPDTPAIGAPSGTPSDVQSAVSSITSDIHSASTEAPAASQGASNTTSVNQARHNLKACYSVKIGAIKQRAGNDIHGAG